MKRVGFYTLGCRVNQYETQAMSEIFKNNGYIIANFNDICDVYIVNSCTVTKTGDKKSRQELRSAKRRNKDAVCALVGCYAQSLLKNNQDIEEADIISGNGAKDKILQLVNEYLENKERKHIFTEANRQREYSKETISSFDGKTRAMLKIQDGCDRYCSYCIIPYVRGPVKSRKFEEIIAEAKRLADAGYKEITITGIQVAAFGQDTKEATLADVIEEIAKIDEIKRIRLGSLEPVIINDEFLTRVKNTNKFCPSFHLSLQSGSDSVLERMNRRYKSDRYFEAITKIQEYFPYAALTTDIIVGFPGETEEEFNESAEFAKKVGYTHIHVFPYSRREGTKAADMKDQVLKSVKDERVKKMTAISEESHKKYLESLYGKRFKVLFETYKDGIAEGLTENYIEVFVKSDNDLTGQILEIELNENNCG